MQYSHQAQVIAQMWASRDMDEFLFQLCECDHSYDALISDLRPVSGLRIKKAMFARMKLFNILKSPTHRAELWEVTVYAWSVVQSYPPCGCLINTCWISDLTPPWKLSSSVFSIIMSDTLEPQKHQGGRFLPSLQELPVPLINMLIKTCIKEKTHFHIPSFLYDQRMDQRENTSPHSCFSFHSWFRGQKWFTCGNRTSNAKST